MEGGADFFKLASPFLARLSSFSPERRQLMLCADLTPPPHLQNRETLPVEFYTSLQAAAFVSEEHKRAV